MENNPNFDLNVIEGMFSRLTGRRLNHEEDHETVHQQVICLIRWLTHGNTRPFQLLETESIKSNNTSAAEKDGKTDDKYGKIDGTKSSSEVNQELLNALKISDALNAALRLKLEPVTAIPNGWETGYYRSSELQSHPANRATNRTNTKEKNTKDKSEVALLEKAKSCTVEKNQKVEVLVRNSKELVDDVLKIIGLTGDELFPPLPGEVLQHNRTSSHGVYHSSTFSKKMSSKDTRKDAIKDARISEKNTKPSTDNHGSNNHVYGSNNHVYGTNNFGSNSAFDHNDSAFDPHYNATVRIMNRNVLLVDKEMSEIFRYLNAILFPRLVQAQRARLEKIFLQEYRIVGHDVDENEEAYAIGDNELTQLTQDQLEWVEDGIDSGGIFSIEHDELEAILWEDEEGNLIRDLENQESGSLKNQERTLQAGSLQNLQARIVEKDRNSDEDDKDGEEFKRDTQKYTYISQVYKDLTKAVGREDVDLWDVSGNMNRDTMRFMLRHTEVLQLPTRLLNPIDSVTEIAREDEQNLRKEQKEEEQRIAKELMREAMNGAGLKQDPTQKMTSATGAATAEPPISTKGGLERLISAESIDLGQGGNVANENGQDELHLPITPLNSGQQLDVDVFSKTGGVHVSMNNVDSKKKSKDIGNTNEEGRNELKINLVRIGGNRYFRPTMSAFRLMKASNSKKLREAVKECGRELFPHASPQSRESILARFLVAFIYRKIHRVASRIPLRLALSYYFRLKNFRSACALSILEHVGKLLVMESAKSVFGKQITKQTDTLINVAETAAAVEADVAVGAADGALSLPVRRAEDLHKKSTETLISAILDLVKIVLPKFTEKLTLPLVTSGPASWRLLSLLPLMIPYSNIELRGLQNLIVPPEPKSIVDELERAIHKIKAFLIYKLKDQPPHPLQDSILFSIQKIRKRHWSSQCPLRDPWGSMIIINCKLTSEDLVAYESFRQQMQINLFKNRARPNSTVMVPQRNKSIEDQESMQQNAGATSQIASLPMKSSSLGMKSVPCSHTMHNKKTLRDAHKDVRTKDIHTPAAVAGLEGTALAVQSNALAVSKKKLRQSHEGQGSMALAGIGSNRMGIGSREMGSGSRGMGTGSQRGGASRAMKPERDRAAALRITDEAGLEDHESPLPVGKMPSKREVAAEFSRSRNVHMPMPKTEKQLARKGSAEEAKQAQPGEKHDQTDDDFVDFYGEKEAEENEVSVLEDITALVDSYADATDTLSNVGSGEHGASTTDQKVKDQKMKDLKTEIAGFKNEIKAEIKAMSRAGSIEIMSDQKSVGSNDSKQSDESSKSNQSIQSHHSKKSTNNNLMPADKRSSKSAADNRSSTSGRGDNRHAWDNRFENPSSNSQQKGFEVRSHQSEGDGDVEFGGTQSKSWYDGAGVGMNKLFAKKQSLGHSTKVGPADASLASNFQQTHSQPHLPGMVSTSDGSSRQVGKQLSGKQSGISPSEASTHGRSPSEGLVRGHSQESHRQDPKFNNPFGQTVSNVPRPASQSGTARGSSEQGAMRSTAVDANTATGSRNPKNPLGSCALSPRSPMGSSFIPALSSPFKSVGKQISVRVQALVGKQRSTATRLAGLGDSNRLVGRGGFVDFSNASALELQQSVQHGSGQHGGLRSSIPAGLPDGEFNPPHHSGSVQSSTKGTDHEQGHSLGASRHSTSASGHSVIDATATYDGGAMTGSADGRNTGLGYSMSLMASATAKTAGILQSGMMKATSSLVKPTLSGLQSLVQSSVQSGVQPETSFQPSDSAFIQDYDQWETFDMVAIEEDYDFASQRDHQQDLEDNLKGAWLAKLTTELFNVTRQKSLRASRSSRMGPGGGLVPVRNQFSLARIGSLTRSRVHGASFSEALFGGGARAASFTTTLGDRQSTISTGTPGGATNLFAAGRVAAKKDVRATNHKAIEKGALEPQIPNNQSSNQNSKERVVQGTRDPLAQHSSKVGVAGNFGVVVSEPGAAAGIRCDYRTIGNNGPNSTPDSPLSTSAPHHGSSHHGAEQPHPGTGTEASGTGTGATGTNGACTSTKKKKGKGLSIKFLPGPDEIYELPTIFASMKGINTVEDEEKGSESKARRIRTLRETNKTNRYLTQKEISGILRQRVLVYRGDRAALSLQHAEHITLQKNKKQYVEKELIWGCHIPDLSPLLFTDLYRLGQLKSGYLVITELFARPDVTGYVMNGHASGVNPNLNPELIDADPDEVDHRIRAWQDLLEFRLNDRIYAVAGISLSQQARKRDKIELLKAKTQTVWAFSRLLRHGYENDDNDDDKNGEDNTSQLSGKSGRSGKSIASKKGGFQDAHVKNPFTQNLLRLVQDKTADEKTDPFAPHTMRVRWSGSLGPANQFRSFALQGIANRNVKPERCQRAAGSIGLAGPISYLQPMQSNIHGVQDGAPGDATCIECTTATGMQLVASVSPSGEILGIAVGSSFGLGGVGAGFSGGPPLIPVGFPGHSPLPGFQQEAPVNLHDSFAIFGTGVQGFKAAGGVVGGSGGSKNLASLSLVRKVAMGSRLAASDGVGGTDSFAVFGMAQDGSPVMHNISISQSGMQKLETSGFRQNLPVVEDGDENAHLDGISETSEGAGLHSAEAGLQSAGLKSVPLQTKASAGQGGLDLLPQTQGGKTAMMALQMEDGAFDKTSELGDGAMPQTDSAADGSARAVGAAGAGPTADTTAVSDAQIKTSDAQLSEQEREEREALDYDYGLEGDPNGYDPNENYFVLTLEVLYMPLIVFLEERLDKETDEILLKTEKGSTQVVSGCTGLGKLLHYSSTIKVAEQNLLLEDASSEEEDRNAGIDCNGQSGNPGQTGSTKGQRGSLLSASGAALSNLRGSSSKSKGLNSFFRNSRSTPGARKTQSLLGQGLGSSGGKRMRVILFMYLGMVLNMVIIILSASFTLVPSRNKGLTNLNSETAFGNNSVDTSVAIVNGASAGSSGNLQVIGNYPSFYYERSNYGVTGHDSVGTTGESRSNSNFKLKDEVPESASYYAFLGISILLITIGLTNSAFQFDHNAIFANKCWILWRVLLPLASVMYIVYYGILGKSGEREEPKEDSTAKFLPAPSTTAQGHFNLLMHFILWYLTYVLVFPIWEGVSYSFRRPRWRTSCGALPYEYLIRLFTLKQTFTGGNSLGKSMECSIQRTVNMDLEDGDWSAGKTHNQDLNLGGSNGYSDRNKNQNLGSSAVGNPNASAFALGNTAGSGGRAGSSRNNTANNEANNAASNAQVLAKMRRGLRFAMLEFLAVLCSISWLHLDFCVLAPEDFFHEELKQGDVISVVNNGANVDGSSQTSVNSKRGDFNHITLLRLIGYIVVRKTFSILVHLSRGALSATHGVQTTRASHFIPVAITSHTAFLNAICVIFVVGNRASILPLVIYLVLDFLCFLLRLVVFSAERSIQKVLTAERAKGRSLGDSQGHQVLQLLQNTRRQHDVNDLLRQRFGKNEMAGQHFIRLEGNHNHMEGEHRTGLQVEGTHTTFVNARATDLVVVSDHSTVERDRDTPTSTQARDSRILHYMHPICKSKIETTITGRTERSILDTDKQTRKRKETPIQEGKSDTSFQISEDQRKRSLFPKDGISVLREMLLMGRKEDIKKGALHYKSTLEKEKLDYLKGKSKYPLEENSKYYHLEEEGKHHIEHHIEEGFHLAPPAQTRQNLKSPSFNYRQGVKSPSLSKPGNNSPRVSPSVKNLNMSFIGVSNKPVSNRSFGAAGGRPYANTVPHVSVVDHINPSKISDRSVFQNFIVLNIILFQRYGRMEASSVARVDQYGGWLLLTEQLTQSAIMFSFLIVLFLDLQVFNLFGEDFTRMLSTGIMLSTEEHKRVLSSVPGERYEIRGDDLARKLSTNTGMSSVADYTRVLSTDADGNPRSFDDLSSDTNPWYRPHELCHNRLLTNLSSENADSWAATKMYFLVVFLVDLIQDVWSHNFIISTVGTNYGRHFMFMLDACRLRLSSYPLLVDLQFHTHCFHILDYFGMFQ